MSYISDVMSKYNNNSYDSSGEPVVNPNDNGTYFNAPLENKQDYLDKLVSKVTGVYNSTPASQDPMNYLHQSIAQSTNTLIKNGQEVPKPNFWNGIGGSAMNILDTVGSAVASPFIGLSSMIDKGVQDYNDYTKTSHEPLSAMQAWDAANKERQDITTAGMKGFAGSFLPEGLFGLTGVNPYAQDRKMPSNIIQSLSESNDPNTAAFADTLQHNAGQDISKHFGASDELSKTLGNIGMDIGISSPIMGAMNIEGTGKAMQLLNRGSKALESSAPELSSANVLSRLGEIDNGVGGRFDAIAKSIVKGPAESDAQALARQYSAQDILSRQNEINAPYLAKKALDATGHVTDYNGIGLGRGIGITPEQIASIGDNKLLKYPAMALNALVNPASAIRVAPELLSAAAHKSELLGSIADSLSNSFLGGKYQSYFKDIRNNPASAIDNIITMDRIKKNTNVKNSNIYDANKLAEGLNKQVPNEKLQQESQNIIEKPFDQTTSSIPDPEKAINPDFLKNARNFNESQINTFQKQLDDYTIKLHDSIAEGVTGVDLVQTKLTLNKYQEAVNTAKSFANDNSVVFKEQLSKSGYFDNHSKSIQRSLSELTSNPMNSMRMSLDELTSEIKRVGPTITDDAAHNIAIEIKQSADNVKASITKKFPEWADSYTGSTETSTNHILNPNMNSANNAEAQAASDLNDPSVNNQPFEYNPNTTTKKELADEIYNWKNKAANMANGKAKDARMSYINDLVTKYKAMPGAEANTNTAKAEELISKANSETKVDQVKYNQTHKAMLDWFTNESVRTADTRSKKFNVDSKGQIIRNDFFMKNIDNLMENYKVLSEHGRTDAEIKAMNPGAMYNEVFGINHPEYAQLMNNYAKTSRVNLARITVPNILKHTEDGSVDMEHGLLKDSKDITYKASNPEYKTASKELRDIITGLTGKEKETMISRWEDKYKVSTNFDLEQTTSQKAIDVANIEYEKSHNTNQEIDKYGQQIANEKQASTASRKSVFDNKSDEAMFNQIHSIDKSFSKEQGLASTSDELRNYMKSVIKGNDNPFNLSKEVTNMPGSNIITKKDFITRLTEIMTGRTKKAGLDNTKELELSLDTLGKRIGSAKPEDVGWMKARIEDIKSKLSGEDKLNYNPDGSVNKTTGDKISEFLNFDKNGQKLNVDTNASDSSINKIMKSIDSTPDVLKGTNQKADTTLTKDMPSDGLGLTQGDNVVLKSTAKDINQVKTHEDIHVAYDGSTGHGDRTANAVTSRLVELSNTAEGTRQLDDLAKLTKQDSDSMYRGYSSDYAKQVGDSKVSQRIKNQEQVAELGSQLLSKDASISAKAHEVYGPKVTDSFYKMLAQTKFEDLHTLTPETKTLSSELNDSIIKMKGVIDNITNLAPDETMKSITEKIAKYQDGYGNNDFLVNEYDKAGKASGITGKYIDKSPIEKITSTDRLNNATKGQRSIIDTIKQGYKKAITEENSVSRTPYEAKTNYSFHMLNPKIKQNSKAMEWVKNTFGDIRDPENKNALQRKYSGTVDEINAKMYADSKGVVKDFFDTNAVRVFAKRMVNHENFMFAQKNSNDFINTFAEQMPDMNKMTLKDWENHASTHGYQADPFKTPEFANNNPDIPWKFTSDEATDKQMIGAYKEAYMKRLDTLMQSKDYTTIRLNDRYEKSPVLVANSKAPKVQDEDMTNLFKTMGIEAQYREVELGGLHAEELLKRNNDGVYLVRKDALATYNETLNNHFKESAGALGKAWDSVTGLMKGYMIASGRFHANNAMGNVFNSYLQAGASILDPEKNLVAAKIQAGKLNSSFNGVKLSEHLKNMQEEGALEGFFADDFATKSNQDKTILDRISKFNLLDRRNLLLQGNQKIGSLVENQARIVNYLTHIQEGKTPSEASDLVNKVLFNYSDLTSFESGVVKKIVPFYTFIRKNIPLQFERMANNPTAYTKVGMVYKNMDSLETPEEKRQRPDSLKGAIPLGNGKYLNLNLPFGDLNKLISPKDIFSMINPLIKTPLELGFNKNTYFDTPISKNPGATVPAPSYTQIPVLKQLLEKMGSQSDTPNGEMMDAKTRYALQSTMALPESISKLLKGTGPNATEADTANNMSWGTGINIKTVDPAVQRKQAMYDYEAALKNAVANAKNNGTVPKYKAPAQKSTAEKLVSRLLKKY